MRKPLHLINKRFLRLSLKPLLTLIFYLIFAGGIHAQTGSIVNACVCLSNASCPLDGQFTSTLRITAGGAGPWYIVPGSVTGFYVNPSPAPPAQPIQFNTGPLGTTFTNTGPGTFELTGIHIDGQSFNLTATNGITSIPFASTGCVYPHTRIVGDPFVCEGKDTVYSTTNNAGSTFLWTLNHGGIIIGSNTLNSVRIDWSDNSDGLPHTVTVRETSVHGCIDIKTLNVEIEDTITMACNNFVQISLDANCGGDLTADMFLEGTRYDNDSYSLLIQDASGHVVAPNILTNSMIGKTYMVTVKHLCSGNRCMSNMLVLDKTAPELLCRTDTVLCSESVYPLDLNPKIPLVHYTSVVATSNPYVFIAKGANGCGDVTMKYYDNVINESCSSIFSSRIIRTWLALDKSGNFTSCIDTIKVRRTSLADISYPKNWDGLPQNNPFLHSCGNFKKDNNGNPHPDLTGKPDGPLCGHLMVTYSDKRLYLCKPDQNSFKVLRHWVVMDNCTGESYDTIQIIAVMDVTKPVISITGLTNNTLTVNTTEYNCGSDVVLPVPVITDCSSTTYKVKYQVADELGNFPPPHIPFTSVPFVGGKYKIPFIPAGLARVLYIAEDACGNESEFLFTIKVVDNLRPQAVCDKHTSITLNENGIAYLGKMTFDDGSYDNCTPVTFRVRRMSSTCNPADTNWGDGLNFCCADVGAPVMVELEVTDKNGFKNTCMAEVLVSDKEVPQITCPTNGEVSCKFDYSNLSVFGTVRANKNDVLKNYITDAENGGYRYFGLDGYATDNCFVEIETLTPSIVVNNCGIGTITRYFRAKDKQGNLSGVCSQTIKIKDFRPFVPGVDIDWPDDYNTTACLGTNILPDNLPSQYGWPKLLGEDRCSMVAMDYDDLIFEHIDGYCYKILRKWRVIDWCQYNQNDPINSPGYWEYTQYLMFTDNSDPVVTGGCQPKDIVALGDCRYRVSFEASGTDNCTASQNLAWSYKLQKNNSTTDVVTGNSKTFSVELSKGTHRISWFATDHCGNVGQCSQTFNIADNKKPTPQCVEGLVTVLLPQTGQVTINASSFNVHSFDDCTKSNYGACGCLTDLKFSFSSNVNNKTRLLTCANIADGKKDTIELEMWVTDESGNQDFCRTYIVLQDNSNVCPDYLPPHDTTYYNLNGLVMKPNDQPVNKVEIILRNDENSEFRKSNSTNTDGKYFFNKLADNISYFIDASKSGDDANGLSTLDIVYIQKHILNIKKLDSPYKLIAADVNNSGNISAADILELRKIVLGEMNNFKNNSSWKFLDSDLKLGENDDLRNIESKVHIGLQDKDVVRNYTAIKIGDVNYSAITTDAGNMKPRNANDFELTTKDASFKAGETFRMTANAKNNINCPGLQFTFEFNPVVLVYKGISSNNFNITESNVNTNETSKGLITVSVDETLSKMLNAESEVFSLEFQAISDGTLSQNAKISSRITGAEIYENYNGTIEERPLKLRFDDGIMAYDFKVYQNNPNPFSEETSIGFVLPEDGTATLTIYDLTGKKLYQKSKTASKGLNEFEINNRDLDVKGMLYYKLESGQYSEMKKMILIR
ncbi:MAG: T9SS type A sorting domain-containing protein [Deltaproteobacteria bacterium]